MKTILSALAVTVAVSNPMFWYANPAFMRLIETSLLAGVVC